MEVARRQRVHTSPDQALQVSAAIQVSAANHASEKEEELSDQTNYVQYLGCNVQNNTKETIVIDYSYHYGHL